MQRPTLTHVTHLEAQTLKCDQLIWAAATKLYTWNIGDSLTGTIYLDELEALHFSAHRHMVLATASEIQFEEGRSRASRVLSRLFEINNALDLMISGLSELQAAGTSAARRPPLHQMFKALKWNIKSFFRCLNSKLQRVYKSQFRVTVAGWLLPRRPDDYTERTVSLQTQSTADSLASARSLNGRGKGVEGVEGVAAVEVVEGAEVAEGVEGLNEPGESAEASALPQREPLPNFRLKELLGQWPTVLRRFAGNP
jgi:hypothetical protein